jgi:hypothetical protein
VGPLVIDSVSEWLQGYADQALALVEEIIAETQALDVRALSG